MNLYEVTNGYIGNGTVRLYAWAEDERQAKEMAIESFLRDAGDVYKDTDYWENLDVRFLFSETDLPFATDPDDDGWSSDRTFTGGFDANNQRV